MLLSYLKEHYGDIASVVGLLVTFIGFIATKGNVRKAKKAAEEAKGAAREAVDRIKSQVLVNEIVTCLQLVRGIDAACRERSWKEAIDRCDQARTALSRLRDHHALGETEQESLVRAVDHLGKLMPYIQKTRNVSPEKDISPQKAYQLHTIITALGQVQGRLQSDTIGV